MMNLHKIYDVRAKQGVPAKNISYHAPIIANIVYRILPQSKEKILPKWLQKSMLLMKMMKTSVNFYLRSFRHRIPSF